MKLIAIIAFLALLALNAGNAEAVEFKLGEFNISMNTPETIDHISYASDTYSDYEVNKATFKLPLFLSYEVTVLSSLSKPAEEFKSTPIPGPSVVISNTTMDGMSAVIVIANQYTTVEYVKDEKTLITLQIKEAVGTDFSDSIAETIKSFKATRA
jgi:hypothetical protein